MTKPTARELLAQADHERRKAHGAEMARVSYRLLRQPVAHRKTGLIGWLTDRSKAPDEKVFKTLPSDIHDALYEALGIVMRESRLRADELEAKVQAKAADR